MKLIFTLIICSSIWLLAAEVVPITWGIKTGPTLALHYGNKVDETEYRVSLAPRMGINAGFWMAMEILPHLSLGYEFIYAQKGSREEIDILKLEGEELSKPIEMSLNYNLDYLEMPVLFKLRAVDHEGWSIQAITGVSTAMKVYGRYRMQGLIYMPNGDEYDEVEISDDRPLDEANIFDFGIVSGAAITWKSKPELSAELRFTLGWDHISMNTSEFTDPVDLRNQSYSLLFGIKF